MGGGIDFPSICNTLTLHKSHVIKLCLQVQNGSETNTKISLSVDDLF